MTAAEHIRKALELADSELGGHDDRLSGHLRDALEELEPEADGVAEGLVEHWRQACGHPGASSKGRVEKVRARLREKFTPDQIREAIDWVAKHSYVTAAGRAKTGTRAERFDDLELICRNPIKLERFIELAQDDDGDSLTRKLVGE